ncbi:MAG: damage-control phosphatase ARMT1 family protein [Phycisphaerae bacterium]
MNTCMECIPCFIRQTLDVLDLTDADEPTRRTVLRAVLREMAEAEFDESPPALARRVHRVIRESIGCEDPYRAIKAECNELALTLYDDLRQAVLESDDPLAAACRLAIVGNVIDYGVQSHSPLEGIREVIHEAMDTPIDPAAVDRLRREAVWAERILYLADNAGEIVLDRLLLEQLPAAKVTLVVRGGPILNDALREDARSVGISEMVRVMDNADNAPGTLLEHCSPELRDEFRRADLVIAKGQGNFESLCGVRDKDHLLFLFRLKCPVVCDALGAQQGQPMIVWRDDLPGDGIQAGRSKPTVA